MGDWSPAPTALETNREPIEKLAMVRESDEPGMSLSLLVRKHGVNPNQTVPVAKARANRCALPSSPTALAKWLQGRNTTGRLTALLIRDARGSVGPWALGGLAAYVAASRS